MLILLQKLISFELLFSFVQISYPNMDLIPNYVEIDWFCLLTKVLTNKFNGLINYHQPKKSYLAIVLNVEGELN